MAATHAAATPTTPTNPSTPPAPLSVSQLATRISKALELGVPGPLRVMGEVSGTRERTHWYFDIKDETSVLSCALFRGAAKKVKHLPSNGAKVIITGRVEFYAPAGKVTFIVEEIEPVGRGSWEAQLKELLQQARDKGWLDPQRKRPLPTFPRAIAIITSHSAAALQDVLVTMQKRCPAVDCLIIDSRVQGQQAIADVVAAFARAALLAKQGRIDAVIITRGGGSIDDLWCFNDLAIAHAIVHCPVPVVAAIGHETDTTIAELVADERCATPTQAAMRLTPDRQALAREVQSIQRRMLVAAHRAIERRTQHLTNLTTRAIVRQPTLSLSAYVLRLRDAQTNWVTQGTNLVRFLEHRTAGLAQQLQKHEPSQRVRQESARVAAIRLRLDHAIAHILRAKLSHVDATFRQLHAIGPTKVLERGYSVTTLPDGSIIRDPAQAPPGTTLSTRVQSGQLTSTVNASATTPWLPQRTPKRSKSTTHADRTQNLFSPPPAN